MSNDASQRKSIDGKGKTLRETAIALGFVTGDQFDAWVKPEEMVGARK